ncbi:MAG: hypothetical protein NVS1B11_24640 [Terriglobales bacterium]
MSKTHMVGFARLTAATLLGLLLVIPAQAEIRSKSKQLVVVGPADLPEQAQVPGQSFFLYPNEIGTYLYIEQQEGKRLIVFDVTDPGTIKVVSSVSLTTPGAFDFVRSLDGHAEFIRFRNDLGVGVLDLEKPKNPTLKIVSALSQPGRTEPLGESGFLMVNEPYDYISAVPRDYQIVDTSAPSDPVLLATVKQVKHKLVNRDTGTTFLLGSEGLTIIRRPGVEEENKIHEMQINTN